MYWYYMIVTKAYSNKEKKVEYRKTIVKTKSIFFPYIRYALKYGAIYAIIACFRVNKESWNTRMEGIYYTEL